MARTRVRPRPGWRVLPSLLVLASSLGCSSTPPPGDLGSDAAGEGLNPPHGPATLLSLRVAIIDQFYPGDGAFADAGERQRQLLLHDAADIDGDFQPDPYYHGDLVRLFVATEGIETLEFPVFDLGNPKRDILAQLQNIRRQVDAGVRVDAVLLCWESSTLVSAFGDSLRSSELPRYRSTIRRWGTTSESWRLTDAIIAALEELTERGLTVVTIAGNAGIGWVNTYAFARGVVTVGGSESDTEGRWISRNELTDAVARSTYRVRLVCDPDRPAFGYDIDGDGRAEIPINHTSGFGRLAPLPRESWRVLKGSSFAAPTALRELAAHGLLRSRPDRR